MKRIDRLRRMLEEGGFLVETGSMDDFTWMKATEPNQQKAELQGDRIKGSRSIHFSFSPDGKAITDITLTQDVWERTDESTIARMTAAKPEPKTGPCRPDTLIC